MKNLHPSQDISQGWLEVLQKQKLKELEEHPMAMELVPLQNMEEDLLKMLCILMMMMKL